MKDCLKPIGPLLLSGLRGNLPSPNPSSQRVEWKAPPLEVYAGMKTNMGKFLGSAALLALFTGCASVEDEGRASGAPPAVVIERERSAPVVIEKEVEKDSDDKEVEVDLEVDKD